MEYFDYLIVGGGIAGITAAETIREEDRKGSIAVISDEEHPLYSRVMLPHYINGSIRREQLFLRRGDDYTAKGITFFSGQSAEKLNAAGHVLTLESGEELGFGKLLIASGGRPRSLGISGENLEGVSRFQTIEDAERMISWLSSARKAVVIGGGFIAMEYLDVLSRRRIPASIILSAPYFFSGHADEIGGKMLHDNLLRHGVESIITDNFLKSIIGRQKAEAVLTGKGKELECDFLGIGIGLQKNTDWLFSSGLEVTMQGVRTDEFLETAIPGIFAAGDAAYFYDPAFKKHMSHGTWSNSFMQGQTAGRNMMRSKAEYAAYKKTPSYSIKSLDFIISLVGETAGEDGVEAKIRLDAAKNTYERFFFKDDRLIGAFIINRPEDKRAVTELIGQAVVISDAVKDNFADMAFDIAAMIA